MCVHAFLVAADDLDLTHWQKLPGSFLPHPPADMDLTGMSGRLIASETCTCLLSRVWLFGCVLWVPNRIVCFPTGAPARF
jgi:hypothetical protein